jgi:hypothetical protein
MPVNHKGNTNNPVCHYLFYPGWFYLPRFIVPKALTDWDLEQILLLKKKLLGNKVSRKKFNHLLFTKDKYKIRVSCQL